MLSWRDNRLSANGDTQARRLIFPIGASEQFALTYDGLNRLTSVSGPVAESFVLDQASNIDSRTGPTQDHSYDQANRLTGDGTQSFTWSNADRLTNRGADTFGYDPLDRLTSSTVAGSARTYAYNGDGLLQSRTGSGATTFLWDASTSPSREVKQGSDNIVYGLGPLYVVKADATTLTFARDGGKNVRAEVNGAGSVTGAFRYRSYGQLAQSTTAGPQYLGLASQLTDVSGLLYLRARWYDPTSGRFLSRDPSRGEAASPGSLNAYAYALGNPLLLGDPTGLRAAFDDVGDECPEGGCQAPRASNWAYAIADVFRDLDSEDTGTRAAAYAKVGLTGLAAGVAAAGAVFVATTVAAGGAATAAGATAAAEASTAAGAVQTATTLLVTQLPARAIAGAGTAVLLRDAPRLVATYGGRAADWAKMTTVDAWRVPWMRVTVQGHWYENLGLGLQVELKIVEHFWKR